MNVMLAYGKTGLLICLPDEIEAKVLEPTYEKGLDDPAQAIREALQTPIKSEPLARKVKKTDRVGIVFSDITRPTPNHLLIPALLGELADLADEQILLFNATGTHRPNTTKELQAMLGDDIIQRFRIVQNDARASDAHECVGTTAGGNAVWIHREFLECDVRILTGFIEPHFFAGFSGGPKACVPGLARLDTIMRNHSPQYLDNVQVQWGQTYGNPLWEDIMEATRLAEPIFLLNVALNRDKEITGVFAGDLVAAHQCGCEFVKTTAMVPVKELFDIVITTNAGYPLDLNLYQSVKGMSAASQIVREGGAIIVAADCWDGIPEHGDYGRLLSQAAELDQLLQILRTPGCEVQDMWQAHIHAMICNKADVYFYSDNLTDRQISDLFLHPCRDIMTTVERLCQQNRDNTSVCVLPQGPMTVPYVC